MKQVAVRDLSASGLPVVDVREPWEFAGGHVPGAVNIPLGSLVDRLDEVRGMQPVAIVCQSGGRSARAVAALEGAGVQAVDVEGGTSAWTAAGLGLES